MADNKLITDHLTKIKKSQELEHQESLQKLLEYLTQSAIKGYIPKEMEIAIDVFEKNAAFNPSKDPVVRVYVHRLREKLIEYYKNSGKHDKIKFHLVKGRYEIKFLESSFVNNIKKRITKLSHYHIFVISSFLITVLLINYCLKISDLKEQIQYENLVHESDLLWDDFLSSTHSALIVLGNHVSLKCEQSGPFPEQIYWQNYLLTEDIVNAYNIYSIKKDYAICNDLYLFEKNSIWGLPNIMPVIIQNKKDFSFKAASDVIPDDLNNHDIIFIGACTTLRFFQTLLHNLDFYFRFIPWHVAYRLAPDDSIQYMYLGGEEFSGLYHRDIGVIAKMPGPNMNEIVIFTSFNPLGISNATKYFTDISSLKFLEDKFKTKYGYIPKYFLVVVEFRGIEEVNFEINLQFVKEIKKY
jgi:hypothetical protein